MAGLLRRAAARRGGDLTTGKIKPIGPNFPLTSEKMMGRHGWNRGSYTFWSLEKPIVGPLYAPPWVVGGIHNPVIDPMKHFNTQDRFETMSTMEFVKCFFYSLLPARALLALLGFPCMGVFFFTWLERRREPMETYIDREEYFKDPLSYMYGGYFDHHHYSHMLCHRRAHKWGYAGLDITLESDDHGHH